MNAETIMVCLACGGDIAVPADIEGQNVICPICQREVTPQTKDKTPIQNPPRLSNSKLTNCPDCRHQISVNALFCPQCGKPFKFREIVSYSIFLAWIGITIIGGLLFLAAWVIKQP
ncbi:MAG: zinc-ribbon domain-containing protein [Verrucomicrobiota bacterium]|nr:zinc-ribbon domain-containing protein [Verrucomicrobiota bacterium]